LIEIELSILNEQLNFSLNLNRKTNLNQTKAIFESTIANLNQINTFLQSIKNEEIELIYELTPMQMSLFTREQFKQEKDEYLVQTVYELEGYLNLIILDISIEALLKKYPNLKAGFRLDNEKPVQFIPSQSLYHPVERLEFKDKKTAEKCLLSLIQIGRSSLVDLSQPPLLKFKLLKYDSRKYFLIFEHHHILLDGWSTSLFIENLFSIYTKLAKNEPIEDKPIDNMLNLKKFIEFCELKKKDCFDFWSNYLLNIENGSILDLPKTEKSNKKELKYKFSNFEVETLNKFKRKSGCTLNSLFQSIWSFVLSKYLNQTEVCFGILVSNRNTDLTDNEQCLGLLANIIPFRINVSNIDLKIDSFIQLIQKSTSLLQTHSFISLSEILSRNNFPLFNTVFVFENFPRDQTSILLTDKHSTLTIRELNTVEKSEFDLALIIDQIDNENLELSLAFNKIDFFYVNELCKSFLYCLRQFLTHEKLSQVKITDQNWIKNEKSLISNEKSILNLIKSRAEQCQNSTAIEFGDSCLTYHDLINKIVSLSKDLSSILDQSSKYIGIYLNKSIEQVICILSVWYLGLAYVPLDPNYPKDRLNYMINDSGLKILLTSEKIDLNYLQLDSLQLFKVESLLTDKKSVEKFDPVIIDGEKVAYLIYTSGTTGYPKATLNKHKSLINLTNCLMKKFEIDEKSRILLFPSFSFDAFIADLCIALSCGACLCLPNNNQSNSSLLVGECLEKCINDLRITMVTLPPSILSSLTGEIKSVKTLVIAGEMLNRKLIQKWIKKIPVLINAYGPSECTVCSTLNKFDSRSFIENDIGKAIDNVSVFILNDQKEVVPFGVKGEIYISGINLAEGYLNRPDLSRDKFLENIFDPAMKMYKSGDFGRMLKNGHIEYMGRKDCQIKLRGFRIEPSEIEAVLLNHNKNVKSVVVLSDKESLTVFVSLNQNKFEDHTKIKSEIYTILASKLPNFMLPKKIVIIDQIPLSINGKIDLDALKNMNNKIDPIKKSDKKQSKIEVELEKIWNQVLGGNEWNSEGNFFTNGGNSLLAIQLLSRIRKNFELKNFDLKKLFSNANFNEMAKLIEAELNETKSMENVNSIKIAEPLNLEEEIPLSSMQRCFWLMDYQLKNQSEQSFSSSYNITFGAYLKGPLNIQKLNTVFKLIGKKHPILLSNFKFNPLKNHLFQRFNVQKEIRLEIFTKTKNTLDSFLDTELNYDFDLESDVLFRPILIKIIEKNEFVLLINVHHIIFDEWSMEIIQKEIQFYYNLVDLSSVKIESNLSRYLDYFGENLGFEKETKFWMGYLNNPPYSSQFPKSVLNKNKNLSKCGQYNYEIDLETSRKIKQVCGKLKIHTVYIVSNVLFHFAQ
jgi:amino acid adenylation domain-containing protein